MRLCRHTAALAEFSGGSGFCEPVQPEDLFFLLHASGRNHAFGSGLKKEENAPRRSCAA
jgi:hypothetical protein